MNYKPSKGFSSSKLLLVVVLRGVTRNNWNSSIDQWRHKELHDVPEIILGFLRFGV